MGEAVEGDGEGDAAAVRGAEEVKEIREIEEVKEETRRGSNGVTK